MKGGLWDKISLNHEQSPPKHQPICDPEKKSKAHPDNPRRHPKRLLFPAPSTSSAVAMLLLEVWRRSAWMTVRKYL
ncbi:hypothetical protein NC651_032319 [Populus alba x Populus x berolinensis]|nr:hypothetical protein NC651_032319 [Populus alba x Populus x berolinensis]